MTLQMFLCEQIADSGAQKHYDVINVIIGTTCDHCLENGKTRNPQNKESQAGLPISSQAWAIQVEQLFGLTLSVAHNVSQSSFSPRRSVELSLRSMAGLSKVLLRQQRHMQQISVRRPTEIKVVYDRSAACPDCGHPYEVTDTDKEQIDAYEDN
jgi:hypothetical protein